jgi:hypothetical protein
MLTLRGLKKLFDGTERRVAELFEMIDDLIDQSKHNDEAMVERVSKLETKMKIMECEHTRNGHAYTKWERKDLSEWGFDLGVVVIGTCDNCLHEVKKYPVDMKPAEKRKFIDMGILSKEDFPVKKGKK